MNEPDSVLVALAIVRLHEEETGEAYLNAYARRIVDPIEDARARIAALRSKSS